MNARYWQKGETLDYTATKEAVTNGQVVSLGGRIGVAGNDIAKGETGALHVTGVFIMEKAASVTVTMGAALYFEEKITTVAAGNVPAGYAAADAEASDATVLVNIGDPNGAAAEVAAVHDSLALKDTSGKVYDITVSTSGTLTATARE